MVDAPILEFGIELLMRQIEKISSLFGVIESEYVSDRYDHKHFEGDRIVFAKLLMKNRKKPDQFLLPHGIPSDEWE